MTITGMYFIGLPLLALLCVAAASPVDPRQEWELWFAEYDAVPPKPVPHQPALFIFRHRIVPATKGTPILSVLESDVGKPFNVYKQAGGYFADTLPLFAPVAGNKSVSGGEYDCGAVAEPGGYAVTCRSNYSGDTFRSFYQPEVGVRWFEYFCGHPKQVCRYELANGKALFRGEFIDALERSGEIRTDLAFRPARSR